MPPAKHHRSMTAPELLEELDQFLRNPRLKRYDTEQERTRFVALLRALSEVVELPEAIPRICRDPAEDRVVACAVAGDADVIVGGDDDLLVLGRVGDILILPSAQLLARIRGQESEDHEE